MAGATTGPQNEVDWRLFEIHKASMNAVGKAQGRLVTAILAYLAILWGWWLMKPADLSLELPLVKLNPAGLWTITPAVLTVLSLSLIGAMNVMGPVWKRLANCTDRLGQQIFFSDLDTNKNLLDYWVSLKVLPEGSVEPTEIPADISRKCSPYVFTYPLLLLACVLTTVRADYPAAPSMLRFYVYGCAFLQALFGFRIWYRAVCRFFGVRREQTEV